MNKPVGGRGKIAKYPTEMRRIPIGIKSAVEHLADLYRAEEWDGTVNSLNLISSNESSNQPSTNLTEVMEQLIKIIDDQDSNLETVPAHLKQDLCLKFQTLFADSHWSSQNYQTSEIVETEISSEKPDIENQPLTESQTIKKLNRSNQKLERQAAKQQQTIQQQQEKLNQYRQEIKDYKQKLSASEQKNESLNKQVEKLKFAESSLEQANLQNQRLQEQLISLQKQYEFLAADAKSKQKMYDILNEIIDKTTITLGKMKSFVKVSLIAGRGEYPETTINDALYDLHRALESTDIKDGYQLENQALARLGDKPRRLTKKRKQ